MRTGMFPIEEMWRMLEDGMSTGDFYSWCELKWVELQVQGYLRGK